MSAVVPTPDGGITGGAQIEGGRSANPSTSDSPVTVTIQRHVLGDQAVYEALRLLAEFPGDVMIEGWK